jgi:two-component system, NtrC family, sensor histidine kinase HydH
MSSAISEAPIDVAADSAPSRASLDGEGPQAEKRSPASETTDNGQRTTDNGQNTTDQERRLRAQYAEISQLAGGLAHEIRNPLSTLQLNLQLLAEDLQNPETPRERRALQRVERLHHEIQRLDGILQNFLRFARIQDLDLQPGDLNEIVEELRDFYEPHAATRSILIRTHLDAGLPRVGLEPDLFKQALLNLVLNAEHAMPSGGELILTTRRDNEWVVLEVTDTGVGMTDEVRARIFDAFFSTRPAGSGLGLPTTRKIIEGHGGTIHVASEPGKGSRFTIRLPTCP